MSGPTRQQLQAVQEQALRARALVEAQLVEMVARRRVVAHLDAAIADLRLVMGDARDLHVRRLRLRNGTRVAVAVIDGLVRDELIHRFVLAALAGAPRTLAGPAAVERWLLDLGLQGTRLQPVERYSRLADELHRGGAAVFVHGLPRAWVLEFSGFEHRLPEEPLAEQVTRGPREGFTEVLRTNVAAIRRRMGTYRLRVEEFRVGRLSGTRGALLYLAGRVDPVVVQRVRERLARVRLDTVVDVAQLEPYLEERPWSPFVQLRATERPDVCTAALDEGRVVVLLDGTPHALVVPTLFWDLLQSPEDYYLRWPASMLRLLRLLGLLLSLVLPAFYVAVVNFHHELVPTSLMLTIVTSRAPVPLPTLLEVLMLSIGFDLVREAGTRMPQGIGGPLTVVGALVVGEAMVRGGLASAPLVVLVAVAAVATLALPSFYITVPYRLLSYGLLLLGGLLGLFGVALGVTVVVGHLAALESMGIPFLAPVAPWRGRELDDTLVRTPPFKQQGPLAFLSPRARRSRGRGPAGTGP